MDADNIEKQICSERETLIRTMNIKPNLLLIDRESFYSLRAKYSWRLNSYSQGNNEQYMGMEIIEVNSFEPMIKVAYENTAIDL